MTLGTNLSKLVSIGSAALSAESVAGLPDTRLGAELGELLAARNGFYAYTSALHVRPAGTRPGSLGWWNAPERWRSAYPSATALYCFAEDIFGMQFALAGDVVVTFDPETGDVEETATSVEGWAVVLDVDPDTLTGYPLAHDWQDAYGPLPAGSRLVPKQPFVLGGDFTVENMTAMEDERSMRLRADLARQLVDLPDGATVRFRIE
jgi:hypothetical protein